MLKKIAERNRKFEGSDRMAQRVMIARDVIRQIDLGHLVPTQGTYASKSHVRSSACRVCALGAMAVSVMDGEALGQSSHALRVGLGPYFDEEELELIESLFEGWRLRSDDRDTVLDCSRWHVDGARARLRALMKSIAENEGKLMITRVATNLRWSRRFEDEEE